MRTLALDSRNVFGSDGSGNQVKSWLNKRQLLKINSKFRESTKEVDAYILGTAFGLNCAKYTALDVIYKGVTRKACLTESFLCGDEIEITASEMLDFSGRSIPMTMSSKDYFYILVDVINKYTGLPEEEIALWIMRMLVFDYIICNDDRHLTNFEVLYSPSKNTFRFAPYYDQGGSFLRTDANLSLREYELAYRKFKSKPFSTNPDKNLCDLAFARSVFISMMQKAGGIDNIKSLGLGSGHLSIVLRQIARLRKLLNV